MAAELLYGLIQKSYRHRKLAKVTRQMRLGQLDDLQAALTRRSWATAQPTPELETHLEWWRAWYYFCRPHLGLRQKPETQQARKGQQTARLSGESSTIL